MLIQKHKTKMWITLLSCRINNRKDAEEIEIPYSKSVGFHIHSVRGKKIHCAGNSNRRAFNSRTEHFENS